jgi:hypothetical protein
LSISFVVMGTFFKWFCLIVPVPASPILDSSSSSGNQVKKFSKYTSHPGRG